MMMNQHEGPHSNSKGSQPLPHDGNPSSATAQNASRSTHATPLQSRHQSRILDSPSLSHQSERPRRVHLDPAIPSTATARNSPRAASAFLRPLALARKTGALQTSASLRSLKNAPACALGRGFAMCAERKFFPPAS